MLYNNKRRHQLHVLTWMGSQDTANITVTEMIIFVTFRLFLLDWLLAEHTGRWNITPRYYYLKNKNPDCTVFSTNRPSP